jgi:hypothetical protein
MIAAMVVITAALLRHYSKIFDLAAIAIVGSSGLLYHATHRRRADRSPSLDPRRHHAGT